MVIHQVAVYGVCIMNRKQIYLEPEQEQKLKRIAEREETTVSAVIRDALDRYLATELTPDVPPEKHPLWALVGIIDDDDAPTNGSVDYKVELYGPKT